MKITDVTLTLFAWDNIPSTSYGSHSGQFAGSSALGLLRLITDQGVEGRAVPSGLAHCLAAIADSGHFLRHRQRIKLLLRFSAACEFR